MNRLDVRAVEADAGKDAPVPGPVIEVVKTVADDAPIYLQSPPQRFRRSPEARPRTAGPTAPAVPDRAAILAEALQKAPPVFLEPEAADPHPHRAHRNRFHRHGQLEQEEEQQQHSAAALFAKPKIERPATVMPRSQRERATGQRTEINASNALPSAPTGLVLPSLNILAPSEGFIAARMVADQRAGSAPPPPPQPPQSQPPTSHKLSPRRVPSAEVVALSEQRVNTAPAVATAATAADEWWASDKRQRNRFRRPKTDVTAAAAGVRGPAVPLSSAAHPAQAIRDRQRSGFNILSHL